MTDKRKSGVSGMSCSGSGGRLCQILTLYLYRRFVTKQFACELIKQMNVNFRLKQRFTQIFTSAIGLQPEADGHATRRKLPFVGRRREQ